MNPSEFVNLLYGGDGDGWLTLNFFPNRKTTWFRINDELPAFDINQNCYLGIGVRRDRLGPEARGKSEDIIAIPGLWLDLDFESEQAHKAKGDLPPDINACLQLVSECPLEPSLVIHSGHGLQAYWLFNEPWYFENEKENQLALSLINGWQLWFKDHAKKRGWHVDSTHDLARVFRIPGTYNCKTIPVLVEVLSKSAIRYEPSDFEDYAITHDEQPADSPEKDKHSEDFRLDPSIYDTTKYLIIHGDTLGKYPSRSEAVYSVVSGLVRCGYSDDAIVPILTNPSNGISPLPLEKGVKWIRSEIERARRKTSQKDDGGTIPHHPSHDDGKTEITVDDANITEVIDKCLDALIDLAPNLYQRDGFIVATKSCIRAGKYGMGDDLERLRIVEAGTKYLQELCTKAAHWLIPTRRKGDTQYYKPGMCPEMVAQFIKDRMSLPFPVLKGVTSVPTIRADGSILDKPGYDASTGLYYAPDREYKVIPHAVSNDDSRAAIKVLKEPFADFPFAEPAYQSAAIAAILSVICRHLVRAVPLFAITSNTRGTGKGLLSNVVSVIATGQESSKSSAPSNDEEARKLLLVIAMDGDRITCFDNATGVFGGNSLERVITEPYVKDRILGSSKSAEIELQTVFFATGNNLRYGGDMMRRVLPITLSPNEENPETRSDFQHKRLLEWVEANQPRLLMAALTIIKAYIDAGKPAQDFDPWGSFEQWSDLVRSALVWAGEPDPCITRKDIEADADTSAEDLRALINAWHAVYPNGANQKLKLKDVVVEVKKLAEAKIDRMIELGEALLAFDYKAGGKISDLDVRRLSQRLPVNQGASRVIDGMRIRNELGDKKNKVKTWWVECLEESSAHEPAEYDDSDATFHDNAWKSDDDDEIPF